MITDRYIIPCRFLLCLNTASAQKLDSLRRWQTPAAGSHAKTFLLKIMDNKQHEHGKSMYLHHKINKHIKTTVYSQASATICSSHLPL
jgi:hypothetical protein